MKILYKSIPADKEAHGFKYKKGKWYKTEGKLEICRNGFHASKNIINAMAYVPCGWIAKVQVRGKSIVEDDKECWEEIKIIEWYKWNKKDSVALAIYAAELKLDNFEKEYPDDKRPRQAIEAAKKVLKKDTKKNRGLAESARSAAESAWSAAWSAAESAAWSAAWSAAESATSAAWSAAESAIKKENLTKFHNWVIKRKFNKN